MADWIDGGHRRFSLFEQLLGVPETQIKLTLRWSRARQAGPCLRPAGSVPRINPPHPLACYVNLCGVARPVQLWGCRASLTGPGHLARCSSHRLAVLGPACFAVVPDPWTAGEPFTLQGDPAAHSCWTSSSLAGLRLITSPVPAGPT